MFSWLNILTVLIITPIFGHFEGIQLKEVKIGDTVELKCNISFYNDIHWLKLLKGRPVALMVTSLKHNGELAVVWNYNNTHFEGFMEKHLIGMRIIHVSINDLGTYFCASLYQKRMDFDEGVRLYTNQQGTQSPFDQEQEPGGLSLPYQVFAAVLCFGLLGMLLAVSLVHVRTSKLGDNTEEKKRDRKGY